MSCRVSKKAGPCRPGLWISAMPGQLPAPICSHDAMRNHMRSHDARRNLLAHTATIPQKTQKIDLQWRVRSCLLGPHAYCFVPYGKPTPAEQGLAHGKISNQACAKLENESLQDSQDTSEARGSACALLNIFPRAPRLGDGLRFFEDFFLPRFMEEGGAVF